MTLEQNFEVLEYFQELEQTHQPQLLVLMVYHLVVLESIMDLMKIGLKDVLYFLEPEI